MISRIEKKMSDTHVEITGTVVDVAKDGFKVLPDNSEEPIFARLAGKLRQNKIRILLKDRVAVKVSVYDLTHGILTKRL